MKLKLQIVAGLLALGCCAGVSDRCYAQRAHYAAQHPEKRQDRPPQKQNQPKPNANRPPANANRPAGRPAGQVPPARTNGNNPGANQRGEQAGAGTARPWIDRMRDLTPQQRERVMQSSPAFQKLPPEQQNRIRNQFNQWDRKTPQQKADQRERERVWRQLTPAQRDHIKNDIYPKYQQLPPARQRAISQRLGVLQNMPESARNQHLNDPNFTRGMSEEDKAMLRDLSHMHVGGPPEPPSE